ncbi:MAG: ATP-binding protein [Casimicrobiaceae bacterium]
MSGDQTSETVGVPEPAQNYRGAFLARFRMLHAALGFVAAFAAANYLLERDVLRLQLVVEELFTNTIMHGYGKECDEPIEIALRADPGMVTVQYEDAAGTYDPSRTLAASREQVSGPLDQRPVGHLGVHLVAAIVDDMHYVRIGERNHLRIVMRVAS